MQSKPRKKPSPRNGFVALLALGAFGCSAGNGHALIVGNDGSGGAGGNTAGSGGAIGLTGDGGADGLAAHIESPAGTTVSSVAFTCANPCTDVTAIVQGGVAPYTYRWEDGSTSAERRVCANASRAFVVSVTDQGSSSVEFNRPPQTVSATVTANVESCADGGAADGGFPGDASTCDANLVNGAYTGSQTSAALANIPDGSITLTIAKGRGNALSGSVKLDVVGILHAEFPVSGEFDCATHEFVVRGVSTDSAGNLCGCGGRPWVFAGTYDAATQTLAGDWTYHAVTSTDPTPTPPAPHEKAVSPVGDYGAFTAKWTGP